MNFDEYIGQGRIKKALQDMLRDKSIFHAVVFEGSEGLGKMTLASIFASGILCEGKNNRPCKVCPSCKKFLSGNHPDYFLIRPEKDSIGVDRIRLMQEQLYIKPLASERKVYVIDEANKMTSQAQNCLLKTLEEPPPRVHIIMCTSNQNSLLKTIQSRCLRFKFDIYCEEDVKQLILQNGKVNQELLDMAFVFSQGIPGRAVSMLSEDFVNMRDRMIESILFLKGRGLESVIEASKSIEKYKETIEQGIDIIYTLFRDFALYRVTGNEKRLINSDKKDIILENASGMEAQGIFEILDSLEEAKQSIGRNVNYQMTIDNLFIKIWEVLNGKRCRGAV